MSKIYTVNDSYFHGSYCTNSQKTAVLTFCELPAFQKRYLCQYLWVSCRHSRTMIAKYVNKHKKHLLYMIKFSYAFNFPTRFELFFLAEKVFFKGSTNHHNERPKTFSLFWFGKQARKFEFSGGKQLTPSKSTLKCQH